MVASPFLDTSVLLSGLIDMGPDGAAAQQLWDRVADGRVHGACTAWHCCLEFFAVATRLPGELRLPRRDALRLLEEEILARLHLHDLPANARAGFLRTVEFDQVSGGRIYDAHISEIARVSGVRIVVTGNRRHFASLLRHGIRVVSAEEYVAELR